MSRNYAEQQRRNSRFTSLVLVLVLLIGLLMMVGAHLYGKQMYAIGHSDGYQQGSTDTQRIYEETQPEQAKQEVTQ